MFKANLGATDRLLRIAFGIFLISLVFVGPKTAWGWIGLAPLLTGLLRNCPLYGLFGLSTSRRA